MYFYLYLNIIVLHHLNSINHLNIYYYYSYFYYFIFINLMFRYLYLPLLMLNQILMNLVDTYIFIYRFYENYRYSLILLLNYFLFYQYMVLKMELNLYPILYLFLVDYFLSFFHYS